MTINWATITALIGLVGWIIPFVMLFIVPTNRKPSSATAWLLLVFLLPYLGLVLFLVLGSPKLSRRRRAEQHTMDKLLHQVVEEFQQQPELAALLDPPIPPRDAPFVQLNTNLGGMPALAGNSVELLPNYNTVFERIAQDIDNAQKYVHVEYFALSRDEETEGVFAAMERAVSRGVKVRVQVITLALRKYPNFEDMQAVRSSRQQASSNTYCSRCVSSVPTIRASICATTARLL